MGHGRACPLLVVVKRLKPLTTLSGTLYRLVSSMSDHMPVLFNVFEDWNEESVVLHISFVSFAQLTEHQFNHILYLSTTQLQTVFINSYCSPNSYSIPLPSVTVCWHSNIGKDSFRFF